MEFEGGFLSYTNTSLFTMESSPHKIRHENPPPSEMEVPGQWLKVTKNPPQKSTTKSAPKIRHEIWPKIPQRNPPSNKIRPRLHQQTLSRPLLGFLGASWRFLAPPGVSWGILWPSDASWRCLGPRGAAWRPPGLSAASWALLVHFGACGCLLALQCIALLCFA